MTKAALQGGLVVISALLLSGAGGAWTVEEVRAVYDEGRFIEAAELGAALKTSEGHALAAQALAIQGYFLAGAGERKGLFDRAVALAQEAVRLDPANPEAYIQLAHATGRYAESIGVLQAAAGGYAAKVREAIEEALRLDPDNAIAHLSMATWHARIVGASGAVIGGLYGAAAREARRHYERAFELQPDAKAICVEYAFGLLLLDRERNREKARRLLQRAVGKPSRDAVESLYHEQAVARLAALDGGSQ